MGSLSIWHWLVVLLIVVLVFGTKKLRNIGQDLGGAVKGFREGMRDAETGDGSEPTKKIATDDNTIDADVREKADKVS